MRRSDGILVKSLDPFIKIIPYIMTERSDAQNFSKHTVNVDAIDRYIAEKRKDGLKLTYLHFFIAAYVRLIAERPKLNRFIMNSKVYQRNNIFVSMVVKRSMRGDDDEETTVKFEFTGHENIFEVIEIVDKLIAEARAVDGSTETDKLAEVIMSLPTFITKMMVGTLKRLDKLNLLPKSVIQASPFHTSFFLTYLKSIRSDYIYHHLYNFGTTGFFVALGKTVKLPVIIGDEIAIKKCCQIGYTMDERICDGLYMVRSFQLLEKFTENPELLEKSLNHSKEVF